MNKELEFDNVVIAVTARGTVVFISGDEQLTRLLRHSDLMEDHCIEDADLATFPKEPGVYICKLEYWFQQGYSDGYKSDGESDESFRCAEYRKVAVE